LLGRPYGRETAVEVATYSEGRRTVGSLRKLETTAYCEKRNTPAIGMGWEKKAGKRGTSKKIKGDKRI